MNNAFNDVFAEFLQKNVQKPQKFALRIRLPRHNAVQQSRV
ncbi:hypothetical protein [Arthrospira platensis]|nr:hypothetical protein [Arthrospira platensis NCB002]